MARNRDSLVELADPSPLVGERPLMAHAIGLKLGDDLKLQLPNVVPQRNHLAWIVGRSLDFVGIQFHVTLAKHGPAVF